MTKITAQLVSEADLTHGVCAEFLNPHIEAVTQLHELLKEIAEKNDLILGLGDKGALIADMLQADSLAPGKFVPVKKPEIVDYYYKDLVNFRGYEDLVRTYDEDTLEKMRFPILNHKEAVLLINEHPKNIVVIDFFENDEYELKLIATYLNSWFNRFPGLKATFLILQETREANEDPIDLCSYLSENGFAEHFESGGLKVYCRRVPVAIGTSFEFHYKKDHAEAKKPVLLYGTIRGELKCCELRPGEDSTARDIIISLGQGHFKNKLGSLH